MKTIPWNATDEEIESFYNLFTNYDNLLNSYLAKDPFMTNKIKTSTDGLRFKRVTKLRMKKIFDNGKHDSPPFRKFIKWIEDDKERLINQRDNQFLKETNTKDKVIDSKDKEIAQLKQIILDLQKENNELKIELSGGKEKSIIEYREVEQSINDENPFSMVSELPSKKPEEKPQETVKSSHFTIERENMITEIFSQFNETDKDIRDINDAKECFYDWLVEQDDEEFEEDDELEMFENRLDLSLKI